MSYKQELPLKISIVALEYLTKKEFLDLDEKFKSALLPLQAVE